MNWNVAKAVEYLTNNAEPPYGVGRCAMYVREAIEAGFEGVELSREGSGSAKDYGPRLKRAGFTLVNGDPVPYQKGDVAVINGFTKSAAKGIKKDHSDGHMAMFDGTQWISDFKQKGIKPYPGSDYEKAKPAFVIYRYKQQC